MKRRSKTIYMASEQSMFTAFGKRATRLAAPPELNPKASGKKPLLIIYDETPARLTKRQRRRLLGKLKG